MKKLRTLLKNRRGKTTALEVVLITVVIIVIVGIISWQMGYVNVNPNPKTSAAPLASPSSQPGSVVSIPNAPTNVNKKITFSFSDVSGGTVPAATLSIYNPATNSFTADSALTLTSGSVTTTMPYQSGQVLWIKYSYLNATTGIDAVQWYQVSVPTMNYVDAISSGSTNSLQLTSYNSPQVSLSVTDNLLNTYTNGNTFNFTTNPTGSLTLNWAVSSSGTGFISSHDPVSNSQNYAVLWAVVTGTNFTAINLQGFSQFDPHTQSTLSVPNPIKQSNANYYYQIIPDSQLCKQWNGYQWIQTGAGSMSFNYVATGYRGTAATVTFSIQMLSDPTYFNNFNLYGPYSQQLATLTINAH